MKGAQANQEEVTGPGYGRILGEGPALYFFDSGEVSKGGLEILAAKQVWFFRWVELKIQCMLSKWLSFRTGFEILKSK